MPVRRPHCKSRNGCQQCKSRRIKCDESLPQCRFCFDRGFDCNYSKVRVEGSEKPQNGLRSLPHPEIDMPLVKSRLLESKLLHQYSTITCVALSSRNDPVALYRMQTALPEIAVSQTFSLDSMLSLAALHLAHLQPTQKNSWGQIAMKYSNAASSQLRTMIDQVSSSVAMPAFVCSLFLVFSFLGRQSILLDPSQLDPLSEVIHLKGLLNGCQIFKAMAQKTFDSLWSSVYDCPAPARKSYPKPDRFALSLREICTCILEQISGVLDKTGTANMEPYRHARLAVEQVIAQTSLVPFDHKYMFFWITSFQESFIDSVQNRDWVCRAILLPYAVWLHLAKDFFFVGDLGKRLARQLIQVGPAPPQMSVVAQLVKKNVEGLA